MLFNLNDFLRAISSLLDYIERDIFGVSSYHSRRIACISLRIAQELSMTSQEVFDLVSLSILHDNGASLKILHDQLRGNAKERLTLIESMQEHCTIGEENIKNYPFLTHPQNIIKYHHERYDGSGFFNLSGHSIPLMSQIINFADTLDLSFSLTDVYHDEVLKDRIIDFVKQQRNIWFAPEIVEVFMKISKQRDFWIEITDKHINKTLMFYTPIYHKDLSYVEIRQITETFSKIIDAKSQFTQSHSSSLALKLNRMIDYYGIDEEVKMKLLIAADLHDVGKLAISNLILDKPGKLTKDEFDIIKTHPAITRACLQEIKGFEDITEWACNHHEKLNGMGYPREISAEQLDFNSRLLACLDIYQALREDRPYRSAMSHIDAVKVLEKMANEQLIDHQIVKDITWVFQKDQ